MKKNISLLMVGILLISFFVGCGKGSHTTDPQGSQSDAVETTEDKAPENDAIQLSLGEIASTDIVDFALKDVKMCYYASSNSASPGKPLEEEDGMYVANTGSVFVIPTFTIKNKDRGDLEVGGAFADFRLKFVVNYGGEAYSLRGYDINDKKGNYDINISHGGVSFDGGETWDRQSTSSEIMRAGQELTFRTVCVGLFDPASLDDPFTFTVSVPTSSGDFVDYVYTAG